MQILFTEHFKKQLKRLKKKYPKIKNDLLKKLGTLNINQEISIGRSIYKVRIASSDTNKGQSGGFRSYIYLYRKKKILIPLCIYAKSDSVGITENELKYHFDETIIETVKNIS
jgi:mRNA-degrading endonuclease RelE of RelBE toxin-antitoxin system